MKYTIRVFVDRTAVTNAAPGVPIPARPTFGGSF